jgi:hypothetical protein
MHQRIDAVPEIAIHRVVIAPQSQLKVLRQFNVTAITPEFGTPEFVFCQEEVLICVSLRAHKLLYCKPDPHGLGGYFGRITEANDNKPQARNGIHGKSHKDAPPFSGA